MPAPIFSEGKDAKGNYAIQIRIRKDDPIAPYILALAQEASSRTVDRYTGFTEEKAAKPGSVMELQEVVLGLLPEEMRRRFQDERSDVRERVMEAMVEGVKATPMGALLGLMAGNVFQQSAAVKDNPALAPIASAMAGIAQDIPTIQKVKEQMGRLP